MILLRMPLMTLCPPVSMTGGHKREALRISFNFYMPLSAMLSVIVVYKGAYFTYNIVTEGEKSTSSNAQQQFRSVLQGNSNVVGFT